MTKNWNSSEKEDHHQEDRGTGSNSTTVLGALGAGALLAASGYGGGGGGGSDSSSGTAASGTDGDTGGGTGRGTAGTGFSFTVIDPVTRIEGHLKVEVDIDTVDGVLQVIDAMFGWLDQLVVGDPVYDDTYSSGYSQSGEGLTEAPRGALGHWLSTASSGTRSATGGPAIGNYQVITPTCWNASPMDSNDVRGPMEQALVGTPVSNETQPVEVLRVIHSFDPCLSCAVHVMRPGKKPQVIAQSGIRSRDEDPGPRYRWPTEQGKATPCRHFLHK